MIQFVHWQEIVGEAFMPDFEKIEKALVTAKRFNRLNEEEGNIEKKELQLYEKWKQIKWRMRHAGYESVQAGTKLLWHQRGWLGLPTVISMDGKEELRFRYFADSSEPPIFISTSEMIKFQEELQQINTENSFYSPNRYVKALSGKVNIRKRKDIDDFIPEID